ncbi:MAG: resolvase [Clostridiales bacterium GWE2_32_10]|nr:MAG: resolvase [Clostridiales bacterium GWE2_32_10]
MANKTFAYIRVSSKEQKEDRQVEAIKEYCKAKNIDIEERNVIVDKQSGKDFNRAGYKALKEQLLRQGDILIIKELDRLGRDMQMIKDEWQELIKAGVDITIIDNEILNTTNKTDLEKTLISNIIFELLSYMAQKERLKIRQRQAEGIAVAKQKGIVLGRPNLNLETLTETQRKILADNFNRFDGDRKDRTLTAEEFMNLLGLKRNSFYKVIQEYKESK